MSWPLARFKDVGVVVTGTTPNKVEENYGGEIPFVTPGDLGDIAEVSSARTTLTKKGADESRVLPSGSILVCCIGATIGKVGIAATSVVTNQQINSIIFDEKKVYPKFAYYYCCTLTAKLKQASTSTTMPIVNKSNFSDFQIPLPPLAEQKRIAAILDKADAIRRKRQQAIKLADEFLRSVFLDMFGDPVTNPKGWEVKNLGELAELINGDRSSNYPSGDDLKENGILFLNTKNITDHVIELKDPVFITEDKFNSLSRGKLKKNDLVITLRGTLGSCAIFNTGYETGFINAQLMIIRPKSFVTSGFLHAFLTTNQIQDKFQSLGRGAAVPQLTAAQMRELGVYVPPLNLMNKFSEIKEKIQITKLNFSETQRLNLFDAVSQKAFSGSL